MGLLASGPLCHITKYHLRPQVQLGPNLVHTLSKKKKISSICRPYGCADGKKKPAPNIKSAVIKKTCKSLLLRFCDLNISAYVGLGRKREGGGKEATDVHPVFFIRDKGTP